MKTFLEELKQASMTIMVGISSIFIFLITGIIMILIAAGLIMGLVGGIVLFYIFCSLFMGFFI